MNHGCNHVETFRLQHAWHGWKKFRTVAWEHFKAFYKDVDVIVFAWKPNASFGHRAPARALHWHRQLRLTAEDMRRLEGMFKDQVYYGAMQAAEPATAAANTRGPRALPLLPALASSLLLLALALVRRKLRNPKRTSRSLLGLRACTA